MHDSGSVDNRLGAGGGGGGPGRAGAAKSATCAREAPLLCSRSASAVPKRDSFFFALGGCLREAGALSLCRSETRREAALLAAVRREAPMRGSCQGPGVKVEGERERERDREGGREGGRERGREIERARERDWEPLRSRTRCSHLANQSVTLKSGAVSRAARTI